MAALGAAVLAPAAGGFFWATDHAIQYRPWGGTKQTVAWSSNEESILAVPGATATHLLVATFARPDERRLVFVPLR
jgi:hypothetical protein